MSEIIDGVTQEIKNISDATKASWMEPVPLMYRKKRGIVALSIGATISILLLALYIQSGEFNKIWFSAVPIIIGFLRCKHWFNLKEIKKYATEDILLSKSERFIKARGYFIAWLIAVSFSIVSAFANDGFNFEVFSLFLFSTSPLLFIGWGLYLNRMQTVMTKEAKAEFDYQSEKIVAEKVAQSKAEEMEKVQAGGTKEGDDMLFGSAWYIRYPIAAATLLIVMWVTNHYSDIRWFWWLCIGIAVLCVMLWARELVFWGIVFGVGYYLLTAISSLPVSAAIIIGLIIGAMIIASAIQK